MNINENKPSIPILFLILNIYVCTHKTKTNKKNNNKYFRISIPFSICKEIVSLLLCYLNYRSRVEYFVRKNTFYRPLVSSSSQSPPSVRRVFSTRLSSWLNDNIMYFIKTKFYFWSIKFDLNWIWVLEFLNFDILALIRVNLIYLFIYYYY